MSARKTLLVCIPCGKAVDYGFFDSFAKAIGEVMMGFNVGIITEASPYIVENRNSIARKVLEVEGKSPVKPDYALWLDSDMVFSAWQIASLIKRLEEGNEIVSGLYYNFFKGEEKPLAMRKEGGRYGLIEESELKGNLVEVDAVGFGFVAMKVEVLKRLAGKYGKRVFDMRYLEDGSLIGEDMVFCERAKEAGYKIMLDPSIVVKHIKGTIPSKK